MNAFAAADALFDHVAPRSQASIPVLGEGRAALVRADELDALVTPKTRAIYCESIANPGGIVVDLFREASHEFDQAQTLDDEWRYGIRDDGQGSNEPVVIDLDEAG